MVKTSLTIWRAANRFGLFIAVLTGVLALLVVALILAERSLSRSAQEQARLDATASAKIVAQEVELAGVELHELTTQRDSSGSAIGLAGEMPIAAAGKGIKAVWLLDSLGGQVVDSVSWSEDATIGVPSGAVFDIGREIATTRHLQVADIKDPRKRKNVGLALIGEPIMNGQKMASIAIALVDERTLLAPAASAGNEGRSFLALLVDGDTVVQTPHIHAIGQQSRPVRLPLPGNSEWYVISGRAPLEGTPRWIIWGLSLGAFAMLFVGFVRERQQAIRVGERSVELERLSAELLRANRVKSEFLASVSHELRTPLNAIVGFVDLLRDGGYGALSPDQIAPVERIATSAGRLRTLVDQVLDIAKIAAGRLEVHREAVVLRPFVLNVVSEIEPLLEARGLKILVSTAAAIPKVTTDPTHLRQILVNLIGNAVKYTNEGSIEIRTRMERLGPPPRSVAATGQHMAMKVDVLRGWLAIDVVDTGIGIVESDQERIFEEFEQVRSTGVLGSGDRGTGLGLPISRRLAVLLGGDIGVESTMGVGSTFTLWLPTRD